MFAKGSNWIPAHVLPGDEKYNIDTVNMSEKTKQLIEQIKRVKLTRIKMYSLVARIIAALGMDVAKLTQLMSILVDEMKIFRIPDLKITIHLYAPYFLQILIIKTTDRS